MVSNKYVALLIAGAVSLYLGTFSRAITVASIILTIFIGGAFYISFTVALFTFTPWWTGTVPPVKLTRAFVTFRISDYIVLLTCAYCRTITVVSIIFTHFVIAFKISDSVVLFGCAC